MNPHLVADKVKRSFSTIQRVAAAKDYEEYKDIVFTERQPRRPGKLREDVDQLIEDVDFIKKHLGM